MGRIIPQTQGIVSCFDSAGIDSLFIAAPGDRFKMGSRDGQLPVTASWTGPARMVIVSQISVLTLAIMHARRDSPG